MVQEKGVLVSSRISSSDDVPSLLDRPPAHEWSVHFLARNNRDEVERGVGSVLRWSEGHDVEVIVVDNGSDDGTAQYVAELAGEHEAVRAILADHDLGEGAGRNCSLKQSLGRYVLLLGHNIEVAGDVFTPLAETLSDPSVGVTGGWGVITHSLYQFEATDRREVDAIEGYLFALRRELIDEVGLMEERYEFYRILDLDYSFHLKEAGYRAVVTPDLPVKQHEHRIWATTPEEERKRLSRKNYGYFLEDWEGRYDLLVEPPEEEGE